MKNHHSNIGSRIGLSFGLLAVTLLVAGLMVRSDDTTTLKDAYKGDFYVGVAINRGAATGQGMRPGGQLEKDVALIKQQYNQIVSENDMKWESIQPREGTDGYNFGPADAFVDFGLKNNMFIVGHTLVWHSQTPNWVFAGNVPPPEAPNTLGQPPVPAQAPAPGQAPTVGQPPVAGQASALGQAPAPAQIPGARGNGAGPNRGGRFGRGFGRNMGYNGPRATREELLARMRDHIHTVVGRYKGKVKVWDVVNEAISDGGPNPLRNSLWLQIIGPDFIAKAFEYAHEADPDAILRYNDYGLENPAKRKKLITIIKELQAQKVPIMAIGSQTHVSVTGPSYEEEDQALTELETLGLPIHITELDVNSAEGGQRNMGADVANNAATTQGGLVDDANQRLATQYGNLFKVFLKHKNSVKVVTLWGVNDGSSWRANGKPLLFDANDQPKPAFDAVIKVAKDN